MPFIWVDIDDEPSKHSDRDYIEKNTIGLLSNASVGQGMKIDQASPKWLGGQCPHPDIRLSGLWNSRSIHYPYKPEFLDRLTYYASRRE